MTGAAGQTMHDFKLVGGITWPGSGVPREEGVAGDSAVHHARGTSSWHKLLVQIQQIDILNKIRIPDCSRVFEVGGNVSHIKFS